MCGEPAHSGQVDSDGDMEEDEEEATAKGTLRTNALLDGLVECLGVGNLHLTGKLGEWETERATLPCGTAEPVGSLTVLGAGKKDKASLLPPLVEPLHALFRCFEEDTFSSRLGAVFLAGLRYALYWHSYEIETDDVAGLELLDGGITLFGIDELEPLDGVFGWDVGLDVKILPSRTEEDMVRHSENFCTTLHKKVLMFCTTCGTM